MEGTKRKRGAAVGDGEFLMVDEDEEVGNAGPNRSLAGRNN